MQVTTIENLKDTTGLMWDRLINVFQDIFRARGLNGEDVDIILVSDKYMKPLNKTYKKRTGTANVLTFDLSDEFTPPDSLSGEIYVSLNSAQKQAQKSGISVGEEVLRLIIHGMLHLTGMTHSTDKTMRQMEEETDRLLQNLKKVSDL